MISPPTVTPAFRMLIADLVPLRFELKRQKRKISCPDVRAQVAARGAGDSLGRENGSATGRTRVQRYSRDCRRKIPQLGLMVESLPLHIRFASIVSPPDSDLDNPNLSDSPGGWISIPLSHSPKNSRNWEYDPA